MINVGILTNSEDQLLPFLIEKIHSIKNIRFYISVVKNNMIEKSLKIFKDRTGNYFISKKSL